jgi:hypothetical protein
LVSIYNALGEEVAHFEVSGDYATITLSNKLAAGIYYAKYISRELTTTSRVIVK